MHELSIVASLFEILEANARENQATKIVGVRLKVGKLAGIVPEFLETAFESYKQGTIAAEAQLEIEEVPLGGHWSGSPYLGVFGALPPGQGGLNPNAGYFHMWHSHTEKEIINFDIFPGGMMSMLIVEPPDVPIP